MAVHLGMWQSVRVTTLKDISRRSGYSVTTVSRALNGFGDVTEVTRQRIQAVARELKYQPNQVARKLVSGRSGMVGLVLEAPPAPFEHGHFFHIVAAGSRAFSAREMDFVLHVGSGEEDVLETYSRLINRGTLDGFIVTAPEIGDSRIKLLLSRDIAFVVHGRDPEQNGYPYVDADNAAISRAAVEHLARLGHTRIALLNGPETRAYARERLRGFEEALAALGLDRNPPLVLNGDTSDSYGRTAVQTLIRESAPPTALLCCNSLVARGAYEVLRQANLDVPDDISVVAHDDMLPQADTAHFDPPLTVTQLPLRDAFEPLASLLVRRINGESSADLSKVLDASLVVRASTSPAADTR